VRVGVGGDPDPVIPLMKRKNAGKMDVTNPTFGLRCTSATTAISPPHTLLSTIRTLRRVRFVASG
jgi:hypothetical protein